VRQNVPDVVMHLLTTETGKCQEFACNIIHSLSANPLAATDFCTRLRAVENLLNIVKTNSVPNNTKVRDFYFGISLSLSIVFAHFIFGSQQFAAAGALCGLLAIEKIESIMLNDFPVVEILSRLLMDSSTIDYSIR
jgi:hypothetical protein